VTSFFIVKAPLRVQEYVRVITTFFSLVVFAFLAWQSYAYANRLMQHHEGTMTLGIPLYPQVYCLTFGSVLMCLVLVTQLIEALRKVVKG
jgi:TRAP-type C4-dicarboxylate transport system permease small subunit